MPGATRKSSKNHSMLLENAVTLQGLEHWFNGLSEKLGWMVIAKAKGMDYKVTSYKKSINRLVAAIRPLNFEIGYPISKFYGPRPMNIKNGHRRCPFLRSHWSKRVSNEYEEHDRKHDLNVLLLYVECLKSTVDKMF